ncbi:MAG: RNA polymerase sigma factor [Nakamurella sp.]
MDAAAAELVRAVESTGEWTLTYAYHLTGAMSDAEDLVQSAVTGVWERYVRGTTTTPIQNVGAYLRRAVLTAYLATESARQCTTGTPAPEVLRQQLESRDLAQELTDRDTASVLLAILSPRERAAVVARYLLDQTFDQIATELGCPSGTVRSLVSRVINRMRDTARERGLREPMLDESDDSFTGSERNKR